MGCVMTKRELGCCGAYCKTCPELKKGFCRGCKLGYEDGKRDINRAKCKMKLCCFRDKGFETCADCSDYNTCNVIQDWSKEGYKYKKYKQSIEFIKKNGYDEFFNKADKWKNCYGKLD